MSLTSRILKLSAWKFRLRDPTLHGKHMLPIRTDRANGGWLTLYGESLRTIGKSWECGCTRPERLVQVHAEVRAGQGLLSSIFFPV